MSLRNLLFAVSVCLSLLVGTGAGSAAERPNILWITCEDMSARLGCYGDDTAATPNLDRLASEGVRYTHAFGVYGVCAPNRHALIMGMYPTSTGAMAMRTWKRTSALDMFEDPALLAIPTYEATPPPEARCFTEYLRAAGYYCTNNSKTDYQFRPPVTAWDESNGRAHWRNRPDNETPFFSVFNFTTPHESGTFEKRSPEVVDPDSVPLPPYYPDTPLVRRDVARHYDNIVAMDGQVGELLAQLEEDGLREETIVFFFSDHGDGLPRMKRWVYDSGLHVPLLVRWPDGWQLWAQSKPLEELYDCEADPHEIRNLASDPQHLEKLAELREAHQKWTLETGDLGHLPESELITRLWPPDGEQPVTADPEISIENGRVTVRCESEGASIAYRVGDGDRWLLYTEPFEVSDGDAVQAQAIRLGWKKSGITKAER